jgi:hypothetical protein
MKDGLSRLLNSNSIEREIEEELRLHLDLLTEKYIARGISRAEAEGFAARRFGNVDQIRDQCLEISMRNSPPVRALKFLLVLVFLIGIFVRIVGTEYHVTRMGTVLIMIGLLGRLLLYVRGLNPSRFFSKPDASSRLILSEHGHVTVAAYDQNGQTPLERLISDKQNRKSQSSRA